MILDLLAVSVVIIISGSDGGLLEWPVAPTSRECSVCGVIPLLMEGPILSIEAGVSPDIGDGEGSRRLYLLEALVLEDVGSLELMLVLVLLVVSNVVVLGCEGVGGSGCLRLDFDLGAEYGRLRRGRDE